MKKSLLIAILALCSQLLHSAEVKIIVTAYPQNTPSGDHIYLAGSINNWNPGDPAFMLQENSLNQPELTVTGSGTMEFKFTRGSWETVEGNENGGFLPNRTFTFGAADTLEVVILSWEDQGGTNHTAAENVIIMDEDFYMPQFDRTRRIWLYLPPDYETSGKEYPVLYIHDGQNLFDVATSFAGEWEVDETLNELFASDKEVPIVVGIDNGGVDRIAEYTPWSNPNYGGGDGDKYAQFVVETLKPYIDANYRTKPGREYTGVMGSSLGGLISFYIVLSYQDVFSKAGIFSPSYWFSDSSYIFAYNTGKQLDERLYTMGGDNESTGLVQEMEMMQDTLLAAGFVTGELKLKVVPGGQHNEYLWRTQFGEAYEWLFPDGSSLVREMKPVKPELFVIYQNGMLVLKSCNPEFDSTAFAVELVSLSGYSILKKEMMPGESFLVPPQLNGVYLARISHKKLDICQKINIFHFLINH